jgi:nitrate reductase beta subunit
MRKTCITCARHSATKGTAAKPAFHGCNLAIEAVTGESAPAETIRWSLEELPPGYLMEPEYEESCGYEGKWWASCNGEVEKKPGRGKTPEDDSLPW